MRYDAGRLAGGREFGGKAGRVSFPSDEWRARALSGVAVGPLVGCAQTALRRLFVAAVPGKARPRGGKTFRACEERPSES
jgi:hypothetical protein